MANRPRAILPLPEPRDVYTPGMRSLRIATIFDIPILVHPSWFLLFAGVTGILAIQVFPDELAGRSSLTYFLMAAVSVLLFFVSLIAHELAHSAVARAQNIPVRNITLFIFGGVAQITREARRPIAELALAIAGPLASVAAAALFLFARWLIGAQNDRAVDVVLLWLGLTNIVVAIFNMIPAFPMDGGRAFRSIIWLFTGNQHRATEIAAWIGRAFAWSLMTIGLLAIGGIIGRNNDSLRFFNGPMIIIVGLFLENAARQSLVQARAIRILDRYHASDLMTTDLPVVDRSAPLGALARGVLEINPRITYFVEDQGKLVGILSGYQIAKIPESKWDSLTAGLAMVPSDRLQAFGPGDLASEVLMAMENAELTHTPVVDRGRVVGVVGRDRLLGVLQQAGFLRTAGA